jgi:hypothetical protein
VNGNDRPDFSDGIQKYTYFSAPAGHTFLWRLFTSREEAAEYVTERYSDFQPAVDWARGLPLTTYEELTSYH